MFGIILLSVVTVMHVYVFWRISSVPFIKNYVPHIFIIITGIVLWALFFFNRFFGHNDIGSLTQILDLFSMTWMGFLFLIFLSIFLIDLVTGFGYFLPRHAGSIRGLSLIAGLLLSVIALVQGLRPPVIQNFKVYLSDLPDELDGTVIIAMADLHLGSLIGKKRLKARITQVREQQPDIVFLVGDISEGHGGSQDELLPVLNRVSAPLGVWAVLGNHEFYSHRNGEKCLIEKTSFHILRNSWYEVRPGLVLAGVDDLTSSRRSGQDNDLISKALMNRPPGVTILLSHSPLHVEKAANAGVDLMISGHTHGGQIWPFDYMVRNRYPFLEGYFVIDGMDLIVTRGAGTWGPRMRLWLSGEILRIILHTKEK